MDTFRRLIFALAIFLLASVGFSLWRSQQPGYGLLNFLRGEKPGTEEFSTPSAPKLNLEDVKILLLGGTVFLGSAIASQAIARVSATLENEAIATVENEATQTDWMGDLCGGLGSDSATGCGRCSAAPGRAGLGHRQVDCRAGVGV